MCMVCKWTPQQIEQEMHRIGLPNLKIGVNFQKTSCFTLGSPRHYNCIAFAAGDQTRHWWPLAGYWPPGIPAEETVSAFIALFESLGYEICDSEELEADFEKVAIYGFPFSHVTHAAKQLLDGRWKSKLGNHIDIEHDAADAVSSGGYGVVLQVMKRRIGKKEKLKRKVS